MNKNLLLLLPLLLAACSTSNTPTASAGAQAPKGTTVTLTQPAFVTAFEAQVQRDLQSLGLTGDLSSQASVAPRSYLNVLKVTDSTARAYFKTSYPAATGCALDWGDGTATAPITTPTPSTLTVDTATHAYTASGTYAIKLTCGTDVKKTSFTAVAPVGLIDFEDIEVPADSPIYVYGQYDYKGMRFSAQTMALLPNTPSQYAEWGLIGGRNGFWGHKDMDVTSVNGGTFNLKSMRLVSWCWQGDCSASSVTAYDSSNQVIGSASIGAMQTNGMYVVINPNWSNVARLHFSAPYASKFDGTYGMAIDDMDVTLNSAN